MSTMHSKGRRQSGAEQGKQQPPEEVVDRLAGLLPEDALQDALKGLEGEQITGPGGLLAQLAGRVIETALEAEMTDHLGYPPGGRPTSANVRNGVTSKRVSTDLGPVEVRALRDRDASFEPKLVAKRQTRLVGLNDKILGLYAGGMTTRDISDHLSELYATDVGRDTISRITDAVLEDVAAWCSRPLIVSIRSSNYKDRKKVAGALRPIYNAANADDALTELKRSDAEWGAAYPMITTAWHEHWPHVIPFLALPDGLRRAVYTTNTIEGLHRQVRKAIKTRGHFPDEQSATKLIYLTIKRADAKWQRNRAWTSARAGLKIHFGDRFPG